MYTVETTNSLYKRALIINPNFVLNAPFFDTILERGAVWFNIRSFQPDFIFYPVIFALLPFNYTTEDG